ncbi:MAG: hypothetical protein RBR40_02995 [Tenuifilaceae bacterium]|nr:hypothetical protein [Tenuifilaceae bacterium]
MPKRKALYYIAFMLLLTALLMVVSNNVRILASFRFLWAPGFLLFTFIFYRKVFTAKNVIAALVYGILYVAILQYTLWNYANDWYKRMIFEDFYAMIVFVLLFAVFHYNRYWEIWSKLAKFSILFMVITGVMTIVATEINPLVVRGSYSSGYLEIDNYDFLHRLGFGSYGYMTAIVALFPILIYFLKQQNKVWLSKKILILFILFLYYILFKAQIFANILVASGVLAFSFMGARRLSKSIGYIIVVAIALSLVPTSFYANNFRNIGNNFESSPLLHSKFNDMAEYIENPVLDEDETSTGSGSRASRYPALLKTFLAAPLLGDASYNSPYLDELSTGGHLYWMSRLALWGIFGFVGYLFMLRQVFKPVLRIFDSEFRFYYYLSLGSTIALGLLKNIAGREPYIMLLIIIPGLYFIKEQFYSRQNSKISKTKVL